MALVVAKDRKIQSIDWAQINTVLLDMDGTLLDLHFDNTFWLYTIPQHYASRNQLSLQEANDYLTPIFKSQTGKLNWYCLDFWSSTLGFDIASLKREVAAGVSWRPHAETFLRRLRASHCEAILITNAHPDTLAIKLDQLALGPWLDKRYTSHEFGAPKEDPAFWVHLQRNHPFDPTKTLFVDDSEHVLAAAENYGIHHLVTLRQPDSQQRPRTSTRYPSIQHFDEIFAGLPDHA